FGDYQGELGNGKDTLTLADGGGKPVDRVDYTDTFPWPMAADALGRYTDWLPAELLPITKHQYKGCSLERISVDGPPGSAPWAANWEASPVDGATPGQRNRAAGPLLPMVEEVTVGPDGTPGGFLRSTDKLAIRARFSSFAAVSNVRVEYYRDDLV